jgi:PAS domain S-box-containing protein
LVAADGTLLSVSSASSRLFGCAREENVGRQVSEFIHPEDLAFVHRQLAQVLLQPDTPVMVEYRICHKNGS